MPKTSQNPTAAVFPICDESRKWGFGFVLAIAIVTSFLGLSSSAIAQGLVGGYRCDANYEPNPAGAFKAFPNRIGRFLNFSVTAANGVRRRIPMADPTILRIGEWFYVTGTSDGAGEANFAIYRSRNLVDWLPHMTAFNEAGRGPHANPQVTLNGPFNVFNGDRSIVINSRTFAYLAAPQLFIAADAPDVVWIGFTARELVKPGDVVADLDSRQSTLYLASCSRAAFELGAGGGQFFAQSTFEPWWHSYRAGPNDFRWDGGGSLSFGAIPVSGRLDSIGTACGQRQQVGSLGYYNFSCVLDPRAWMGIDGHYYEEPLSGRRWLLYTYSDFFSSATGQWGWQTAAYPMFDTIATTPAGASQIANLVRSTNPYNSPGYFLSGATSVPLLNGQSNPFGDPLLAGQTSYGVGEAPAIFSRVASSGQRYSYLLFSRNSFDSPAYGIFYRKIVGESVADFHIPSSVAADGVLEFPVVSSARRDAVAGPSFGHGQVFWVPDGNTERPYLIFHQKDQGLASGGTVSYNSGWSGRTVFIKELTFDGNGNIYSITNDATEGFRDVNAFLVPYSLVPDQCPADLDHDQDADGDDLILFFQSWDGGC